jgi:hypothetical protein
MDEVQENNNTEKVALQALLRIAALERVLLEKGVVSRESLLNALQAVSDELASVLKEHLELVEKQQE